MKRFIALSLAAVIVSGVAFAVGSPPAARAEEQGLMAPPLEEAIPAETADPVDSIEDGEAAEDVNNGSEADDAAAAQFPEFKTLDADNDGKLSLDEFKRDGLQPYVFASVDANQDGVVTPDEMGSPQPQP